MFAAVVHSYGEPPRYEDFADPVASREHEALVDVLAVGLHPRVRSQAAGSHYTSTDELPLIPGVDGVGRLGDGQLVYFILSGTQLGSLAERVIIDRRRSVPLPAGTDPVLVAAGMNPGMSSWVALRRRIDFESGQSVMVFGATGNAGQMAIQVARYLGAGHVVAAGRDPVRLAGLPAVGADNVVSLTGTADEVAARLRESASEVDVVIDYLWGKPTQDAILPILLGRTDSSRALSWIQIGSVAGPTIELPSAALRSANLRLLGSGQGSVTTAGIAEELAPLARQICAGAFAVEAEAVPLSDVERVWTEPTSGSRRLVVIPG